MTSNSEVRIDALTENPTKLWQKLKVKAKVDDVTPLPLDTPIKADSLRFVCVSDTHSRHELKHLNIPDGDVFIHGGDFSNVGRPKEIEEFNDFLAGLPHRRKVVIAGNHDLTFDPLFLRPDHPDDLLRFGVKQDDVFTFFKEKGIESMKQILNCENMIYLEDDSTTICGIQIYGSPWTPVFCDWGFNLPRGKPCLDKWDMIPGDTDVLLTHGPPLGYNDSCFDGNRAGCAELLSTVQKRVKPKYHIFGHIHEAYGITSDGETTYINASTCTLRYKPTHPPVLFDVLLPEGMTKEELKTDLPPNTIEAERDSRIGRHRLAMAGYGPTLSHTSIFGKRRSRVPDDKETEDDTLAAEVGDIDIIQAANDVKPHPMTEDPDRVWSSIKNSVKSVTVKPLSPDKAIKETHLRCVCISDTHSCTKGLQRKIPAGDILLHAGDFTMYGDPREVQDFKQFLESLPHRRKLVVAGNHDIPFDSKFYHPHHLHLMASFGCPKQDLDEFLRKQNYSRVHEALSAPNILYLQDTGVDICGVYFHGSPWQPRHYDWGFNLKRGEHILKRWRKIPAKTDVLITHGPPLGFGDKVAKGTRVGCAELLTTVRNRVKPSYHVFGHIHEAHGAFSDGHTTFLNASVCSKGYNPCQRPLVFDILIPEGRSKAELMTDITQEFPPDFWGVPPVPPYRWAPARRADTTGNGRTIELPDDSLSGELEPDSDLISHCQPRIMESSDLSKKLA